MNKTRGSPKAKKNRWWKPLRPLIGPFAWLLTRLIERLIERSTIFSR